MKICMNTRNKGQIEEDPRVVKTNYELRINYLIEIVLLKKRIICNNGIITENETTCIIADLESCFDC